MLYGRTGSFFKQHKFTGCILHMEGGRVQPLMIQTIRPPSLIHLCKNPILTHTLLFYTIGLSLLAPCLILALGCESEHLVSLSPATMLPWRNTDILLLCNAAVCLCCTCWRAVLFAPCARGFPPLSLSRRVGLFVAAAAAANIACLRGLYSYPTILWD